MTTPRILICYSNPADTSRLRLDIEHSEIEAVLSKLNADARIIKRLHATTLGAIIDELNSGVYEIIQFSGHGDEEGIYLENSTRTSASLVGKDALRRILNIAAPQLRALILTCCFSEAYKAELSNHVPYLISVDGPAPDQAAIQFSKRFLATYLEPPRSIERAFYLADLHTYGTGLSAQLSRRGLLSQDGELKIEAVAERVHKIVLDLTPVRKKIEALDYPKERFLQIICTSLRAHFSLFREPLERVAIPFGKFVGLFSWQNEIDPIVCERFITVSSGLPEKSFATIAYLMVCYASLAKARYRTKIEKVYTGQPKILRNAIDYFYETSEKFFVGDDAEILRSVAPDAFKVTSGIVKANLAEADRSWSHDEYGYAVLHLETALTSMHNLILEILEAIEA